MKYAMPAVISSGEILDVLRRSDASPRERIEAVLSAIFHSESVEFAGDVLIQEFSTSEYSERSHPNNLFGTFYQARKSNYRIDEIMLLLRRYKEEVPNEAAETAEAIEELLEYRGMFGSP